MTHAFPISLLGSAILAFFLSLPAGQANARTPGWTAVASDPDAALLHLRLDRTEPSADAVVEGSPGEIRLFFSEPPQTQGTSLRLADGFGDLVATTEAVANGGDAREIFIVPDEPLAPGVYTVHWRVIAQDGHAQRGDFNFQVVRRQ